MGKEQNKKVDLKLIIITVLAILVISLICLYLYFFTKPKSIGNVGNNKSNNISNNATSATSNIQQNNLKVPAKTYNTQENDYHDLLNQPFTCISDFALNDSTALEYGLSKQNDNIYTKIITNGKDLEELTSKLNLNYCTPALNRYYPIEEIVKYLDKANILLCIKNTNGNYGTYGNYRNHEKFDAKIELDAAWVDASNLRNITINTKELSGKNGNRVIKGYAFIIPKTTNNIKIAVNNEHLSHKNFIDNKVQITKQRALDIAITELRKDGIKDNPSNAIVEIENQYFLERWDDKNKDYVHKYEPVTEEKLIRVWHIYVDQAGYPGCSVNIYIDATKGNVLCYHWTGE